MIRHIFAILFLFVPLISFSYEINSAKKIPTFDSYPSSQATQSTAHKIVWINFKNVKQYHTAITEGYKKGPVLAGYYAHASAGCGTECQINWIIDTRTGRILDEITSSNGISYKINSRLIIVDPPIDNVDAQDCADKELLYSKLQTKYLLITGSKISTLTEINTCKLLDFKK